MGLFTQRPEEPTEWAGLPSEPAREVTDAERLRDSPPADAVFAGLLGGAPDAVESVVIPIAPALAPAETGDDEVED